MINRKRLCEECEAEAQGAQIRDKIWEAQLENHREIIINSAINESVIERVVIQIQNINKFDDGQEKEFERIGLSGYVREPITIFITSPGGSVDLSFAVVSAIEASKTKVITVAIGMSMSGGFLILLAGHERYAQRYASLMYHELSSLAGGKATEVKESAEYLEKLQKRITDYVEANSGIPREELDRCHLQKTDWYMDTMDALDYGVVDGIWPPDVWKLQEDTGELDEECVACIEEGDDDCAACSKEDKPE